MRPDGTRGVVLRVDWGWGWGKAGVSARESDVDVGETRVGAFQRGVVSALDFDRIGLVLLQLRSDVIFQFPSGLSELNLL